MMKLLPLVFALLALAAAPASAQEKHEFKPGPVFAEYGAVTTVDADVAIPEGAVFKVDFDASQGAKDGAVNRTFDSAARFINMHVAAGMPEKDVHVALVVHGPAINDLKTDAAWGAGHDGAANPTGPLVRELLDHGVRILVCGQASAHMGVEKEDMIPGIEMALSAMTAHTLLQQQGYTLIP